MTQRTSSMNERYTLTDGYMEFAPDEGEWVHWSDYSKMCAEYQGEVHALKSQLEAAQALRTPLSDELPKGFLSDVLTAAGLVSHGKQCKALGSRISEAVESIWKISIQQREARPTHGITQEKQV